MENLENWRDMADEIQKTLDGYLKDENGWSIAKKDSKGAVTVWYKTSSDWNGYIYKTESEVKADPETVFSYIDPLPGGRRQSWDPIIKEYDLVERIDKDAFVLRTVTHSAFRGMISSRDFVDLIITDSTPEYLSTRAKGVNHAKCPPTTQSVRGQNYPCGIVCYRVPGEPKLTRMVTLIQTSLNGVLPRWIVDSAIPSSQIDFFTTLKKALKNDGHIL